MESKLSRIVTVMNSSIYVSITPPPFFVCIAFLHTPEVLSKKIRPIPITFLSWVVIYKVNGNLPGW